MQQMARNLIVALWPDGGQGRARRNAWAAMVADSKRARERAIAQAAVREVVAAHEAAFTSVAAGN